MATIICCRSTLLLHRTPTATATGCAISGQPPRRLLVVASSNAVQRRSPPPLVRRARMLAWDVRYRGRDGTVGVSWRGTTGIGSTDTNHVLRTTTTTATTMINTRSNSRWVSSVGGGGGHPPPGDAAGEEEKRTASSADTDAPTPEPTDDERQTQPEILYEGALASATLRLKRVSVTTCAVGLFLPVLALLYGGGDVPAAGQVAVGGTAVLAATGSTAALNYCVSPYVHTLERVVVSPPEDGGGDDEPSSDGISKEGEEAHRPERTLLRATTRNLLARKVETVFDPETDVTHDTGARPFCNFVAKGVPMYVHPELVDDDVLRVQLVGKEKGSKAVGSKGVNGAGGKAKKVEDDEFL